MDFLSALGGTGLPLAPLDVDGLSVPERALLGEWATEHYRLKAEAQKKAQAEARRRNKLGTDD